MFKDWKSLLRWTLAISVVVSALAQSNTPVTLAIDVDNLVVYRGDIFDGTKLATDLGRTTPLPLRTFMPVTWIADVVAVNGSPAKGALTVRGSFVALNPNPNLGTGIGDINSSLASDWLFDLRRVDGAPVGSILASGWAFGERPVGFPSLMQGNLAVMAGTGAFLAVRGQGGQSADVRALRTASVTEDPSNRRTHGGGSRRYTFQLIPMVRPEVVTSPNGPVVFHSDFSPVTASSPARRGEVLIAAASGLGPTIPGVEPGTPFPADRIQEVAAPVQVLVNGTAVEPVNRVGWPGLTGAYRVDFRVPEDTAGGMATVQLIAAWTPGPSFQLPVR